MLNDSYRRRWKRVFDATASTVVLVVLCPLLALIALVVRLRLGSPVLFCQVRPGLFERPFTLIKFRTMREERDARGAMLPDASRLDGFGRWLRSTSLDELPELWNVLRGDMSLVGPRPLLMQYLPRYSPQQRRRHLVRPGLTGLAQVNGRNDLTWEEKFAFDTQYVDACSARMDMRILCTTAIALVRQDGITQPGHATAAEFMGSRRT